MPTTSKFSLRRSLLRTLALGPLVGAGLARAQNQPVTFGIVPQQSATALARVWIPLLQEVAHRSGISMVFRTATDIPTFEERLKAGEYDLAYMNPYHYSVFSRTPGYQAFAKEKARRLMGIVVVAKDSPYTDIHQLSGKTVAFPAPAAFAASMLTRAEFARQNIPITAKYVSSHDSVYRGVAQGIFAAGGGIRRTLEAMDQDVADKLRVLTNTPDYIPHAFAAHPRVPTAIRDKIAEVLLALDQDEEGRKLLEPLSFKGIIRASDGEWDEIRRLKLEQTLGRGG